MEKVNKEAEDKMKKAVKALEDEFKTIRTGRVGIHNHDVEIRIVAFEACVPARAKRAKADEDQWRELIRRVREVTDARLTYAANWDRFKEVPFWDALDAIGIQAYFPLSDSESPGDPELRAGWERVLAPLRELHRRTGKPVVFTEFGYHASPDAARMPWSDGRRHHGDPSPAFASAHALQERCLRVGLEVLGRERGWLRGAFLWKWFVGEPGRGDATFILDTPRLRGVIEEAWRD